MSNYRYKIEEKEYILSKEEHGKIIELTKAGGGLLALRGGSLLVNTNFIRWANKTEKLTDEQIEAKKSREEKAARGEGGLLLGDSVPENLKGESFFAKTHRAFYEKMNWTNGRLMKVEKSQTDNETEIECFCDNCRKEKGDLEDQEEYD